MSIFYQYTISARIRRGARVAARSCYIDAQPDAARSVFICGAGRSGTTWLADVVNHANDYLLLYEPFNREQVRICSHFSLRQYLRPNDNDPTYLEPARKIFTGRIREGWVDQYNRRVISHRRLIKDVRSSLMLKWVRQHFPNMRIVFVMRHPCAVAISKVKLRWGLNLEDAFLSQSPLMTDYLGSFESEIRGAQTDFEKHVVAWCIENFVPLKQLESDDVYFAFYEALVANPTIEFQRLFNYLGMPFDERVISKLKKPSVTSRTDRDASAIVSGENLIDSWRRHVSPIELSYAQRLTALFGLDQLYGDKSNPSTSTGLLADRQGA
jgi:hypothetical protein